MNRSQSESDLKTPNYLNNLYLFYQFSILLKQNLNQDKNSTTVENDVNPKAEINIDNP
ncbi:hypothetical protein [Phaeocystidibacter luteus]|uniref:hypothetical protein n=1 Tax=Phaeocystidibacter luteus TaxID=911197 RepID=UPI00147811EB|nr:hypothetical protein [Phaeocystidibacter luteus]